MPTAGTSFALALGALPALARAEPPPAVVAIRTESPACEIPNPVTCSGIVIAPTIVLTAAHCVAGALVTLEIVGGADANTSHDVAAIADIHIHPRYATGAPSADLALVRLRWPTALPPLRLGAAPALGEDLTWAGYGAPPSSERTGLLHGGTARVTAIADDIATIGETSTLPCGGDSGGAFVRMTTAGPEAIALTRSGDAACRDHATGIVLAAHLDDFIEPYLRASAGRADPPLDLADPRTCGTACTSDADCPTTYACLELDGERRCLHPGIPPSHLGDACERDATCGAGGACLARVTERGRTCGCYAPCDPPRGGGCAIGDGHPGAMLGLGVWWWWLRRRRADASIRSISSIR